MITLFLDVKESLFPNFGIRMFGYNQISKQNHSYSFRGYGIFIVQNSNQNEIMLSSINMIKW